jgi:cytochrome c2
MNTSKQVNIMIGTVLLAILVFGGYIGYEGTRQAHEREETTMRIAERGARLYIANCRSCHGMEGEGHVAPALNKPGFRIIGEHDPSGAAPTPQGEADAVNGFLFNTIACGRTNTFMPVWAQRFGGPLADTQIRQLTTLIEEGRWDLVKEEAAIHDATTGDTKATILADAATLSLTEKNCGQFTADNAAQFRERDPFTAAPAAAAAPAAPAGGAAPAAGGKAGEGKTIATAQGCAACHSTGGAAGVGPTWKGIAGRQTTLADGTTVTADDAYLKEAIVSPDAKVVKGFAPGIMPKGFGDKLKPDQIEALIEYMKSLK